MSSLEGRRIVVAGGTGNVGRHLVRGILEAGGTAVVLSRSAEKLEALAAEVAATAPERFFGLQRDVVELDGRLDLPGLQPIHGGVASLGEFVASPRVAAAPAEQLRRVLEAYVVAHHAAARAILGALAAEGGVYVTLNGPLAFGPRGLPGTGLIAVATAAQAMLTNVLRREWAETGVRVHEVVIYSGFGWGRDDDNLITGADIGGYVARLLAGAAPGADGAIHLDSREKLDARLP